MFAYEISFYFIVDAILIEEYHQKERFQVQKTRRVAVDARPVGRAATASAVFFARATSLFGDILRRVRRTRLKEDNHFSILRTSHLSYNFTN